MSEQKKEQVITVEGITIKSVSSGQTVLELTGDKKKNSYKKFIEFARWVKDQENTPPEVQSLYHKHLIELFINIFQDLLDVYYLPISGSEPIITLTDCKRIKVEANYHHYSKEKTIANELPSLQLHVLQLTFFIPWTISDKDSIILSAKIKFLTMENLLKLALFYYLPKKIPIEFFRDENIYRIDFTKIKILADIMKNISKKISGEEIPHLANSIKALIEMAKNPETETSKEIMRILRDD